MKATRSLVARVRPVVSGLSRSVKSWPGLERVALPASTGHACARALAGLPAQVRGALPLPILGLPEGLTHELLDELCRAHAGARLKRVAHVQLTGWKASWVYRLFLRMSGNAVWTLIYKNAIYDYGRIPALEEAPLRPGPAENAVYDRAFHGSVLRPFVPRVYRSEEVRPGQHYRYLLEDLGVRFRARPDPQREIARALPGLHRALERAFPVGEREQLLDYGPEYRRKLRGYAERQIRAYEERTRSGNAAAVLERWEEIAGRLEISAPAFAELAVPIHGDPNRTNVLFDRREPGPVRFLDWEWAGVGLPHQDFAAAIKTSSPSLEAEVVTQLADADPRISPAEHRDLFQRSKLERGLLDAAFLAAQQRRAGERTRFDIETPLQRALSADALLRGSSSL